MSSKKLKVSVGLDFTSDQMSIEKIREQIDTAVSAVKINLDPESAKKFEAELKELGGLLEKHLNQNTGKINSKNLVADLDNNENFLMIEKLGKRYEEVGVNGQQSFRKVANEADFLSKKIGSSNKTLEKMGTTLMNTVRWNISSSVVNAVTGEFQKMYYFAKDLDRTLTDIRIVSGQSADQMERFALHANKSAQALGVSTNEYAQAATLFFQQGLGETDVIKMTDGAVMASRITGIAAADMADLLTSTMNGYKLAADEVTNVTDKLAAVGATTASDFHELATGMSKVASMANTAGVSIDELNAQIATIVSVTRESPESIGTSLKTIYGRMLMFKTDTKALMEDDDGEVFGAPKVEEALQAYNQIAGAQISLFKTTADGRRELRDLGEVIEEIGDSWNTVTDQTAKFGLTTALAGSRQQNRLVALFDSWDMYKEAVVTSLEAEGTTLEQNAIYMDSYEGKVKGLQAAKEEMYMVLTDSDSMKFFVGALTEGVQLFTKLVDMAGGFSAVLGIIGVAFSDNLVKKAYEFQQAFTIPKEMKETGEDNEQIESLKELHTISKMYGADEANRYREDLRNKKAALKEMKVEADLLAQKHTLLKDIAEEAKKDNSEIKKKAIVDSLIADAEAQGVAAQGAEELRVKYNELAEAQQNLKELEQLSYGEVIGDQIHKDVEDAKAVVDGIESQIDSIHEKATAAAVRSKEAYEEMESKTGETSAEISAKAKETEKLMMATQATRAAFMLLPAAIGGATDSSKSLNEVLKNIFMLSLPSIASALQPVIASLVAAKGAAGALNAAMFLPLKPIALVTGAAMVLAAIIKGVNKDYRDMEEITADIEKHQNVMSVNNENIARLDELSGVYDTIRQKQNKGIELNEEEYATIDELVRINPSLVRGYDERGQAIIDTTQNIDDMIDSFREANRLEDLKLIQAGDELFTVAKEEAEEFQKKLDEVNRKIHTVLNEVTMPEHLFWDDSELERVFGLDALIEQYRNMSELEQNSEFGVLLNQRILEQEAILTELNAEVSVYQQNLSMASAPAQDFIMAVFRQSEGYKNLTNSQKTAIEGHIRFMDVQDYGDPYKMQADLQKIMSAVDSVDFSKAINEYEKLVKKLSSGDLSSGEFNTAVQEMLASFDGFSDLPDDLISRFFQDAGNIDVVHEGIDYVAQSLSWMEEQGLDTADAMIYADDGMNILADTTRLLGDETALSMHEWLLLDAAIREFDENGRISEGTLRALAAAFPDLIEKTGLERGELLALGEQSAATTTARIQNEISTTKQVIADIRSRIGGYASEAEALAALAGARQRMYAMDSGKISSGDAGIDAAFRANQARIIANLGPLEAAINKLKNLQNLSGSVGQVATAVSPTRVGGGGSGSKGGGGRSPSGGSGGSSKAKKEEKDNRKVIDSIDAQIRAIQAKNDKLEKTSELLAEQLELAQRIEGVDGLRAQHEANSAILEHNNKLIKSFKDEQAVFHELANITRNEFKKYNTEAWFDANGEQTLKYIEQFNKATEKQQQEMEAVFDLIQRYKKEWMNTQEEVKKVTSETKEIKREQDALLAQIKEMRRQRYIETQNKLYDEQQDKLSALEDIQERIVAAIHERGREEKEIMEENHRIAMENLQEEHDKKIRGYQDDLDEFRKYIQGRLDALDDQYAEEDYFKQLEKEREEADRLQKEIDVLSLDDSLAARNKTIELRKQLADQNEKIAEMQQNRERDLVRDSLEEQLKNYEEGVKAKEKTANEEYEIELDKLEKSQKADQEDWDARYSNAAVYAEAKRKLEVMMADDTGVMYDKLMEELTKYEQLFGTSLGIMGEHIQVNLIDQLNKAIKALRDFDHLSENRREPVDGDANIPEQVFGGSITDMSPTDLAEYIQNKKDWDTAKAAGNTRLMRSLEKRNQELRGSYGIEEDLLNWSDIEGGNIKAKEGTGRISDMPEADYYKYLKAKKDWEEANIANDQAGKRAAKKIGDRLRTEYGIKNDTYSYYDLMRVPYDDLKIRGYAQGGKIDYTGIAKVHGSKTKPEYVFNNDQFKDLAKMIARHKMPTVIKPPMPSGIPQAFEIQNLINVEGNVTEETIPAIKKAGNDIAEIIKNYTKGGGTRPLK